MQKSRDFYTDNLIFILKLLMDNIRISNMHIQVVSIMSLAFCLSVVMNSEQQAI